MVRMSNIQLHEDQKQKLEELSVSSSELLKHRARLILAYAAGKPTMQAAMEAGISRGRARYWKRQFLSNGMGIFNLETEEKVLGGETHPFVSITSPILLPEGKPEEVVDDKNPIQTEVPFPLPKDSIGVTPDDNLAEAGRKVWLYHFAIMLSHEQGTLLGENIEELHDMRVATRRMRSAFDIFGPAFNPKLMKRYQKGLRKIGRVLGQVRDMDVILEKGVIYQNKLIDQDRQGMDPLLIAWKEIIDAERVDLIKHLRSEEYRHFKQDFNKFLQPSLETMDSISSGNETISRVRDIVPILVYSRYAAVKAYETIVPSASITQLHALRIEFKKFRYALEYFREILNESTSKTINEIKQYQDHLGELHDADVACQLVRGFLKKWEENQSRAPIQERMNPEPIVTYLAYLHAERYRLMITFPELWQNFNRIEFRQNLAKTISLL
jgi:CHAD domain-containing protein